VTATQHANGRVVTVAVLNVAFLQSVKVGDTVCCYIQVKRRGRTSLTLAVEVWVRRQGERVKVTEAEFTFVAVNDQGQTRPVAAAKEGSLAHGQPKDVRAPWRLAAGGICNAA
jgi:acyl-CoA thioesterase YciA